MKDFSYRVYRFFVRKWNRVDLRLRKIAVKSPRLSSFYYALFNTTFDREHRAVIAGQLQWEKSKADSATTSSLLRRNIHRLEKGLIMRPRRDVFALDYIGETVQFYQKVSQGEVDPSVCSLEEQKWAHDVLEKYFKVTASHPKLDPLRSSFHSQNGKAVPVDGKKELFIPYHRDLDQTPSVEFDDLLELAWRRRSVRWFDPRPVPRALIEKALAVAALSPSACNRQPFHFHVFDDPELIPETASLPGGTKGFAHNVPVIIALVGEMRNYYGEKDRHLIYVDASLAAMSFLFAAESLGLSTCCINWPDIEEDEKRADRVLKLEPDQRPVMFIALGYPDKSGQVPYSQKKPTNQLAKFNFE